MLLSASPAKLACVFALASIALQVMLLIAMPNIGMGSMALHYIIWPALVVSTFALFFILRLLKHKRILFTAASILMMAITSISAFPQDSPLSFSQKLDAFRDWTFFRLQ